MLDFKKAQIQYENDPVFNHLVNTLVMAMEKNSLSPLEVREAATYAATRFQMMQCEPIMFSFNEANEKG